MKKQTSIYLSEKDYIKLAKIKDVYEADSASQVLKTLIEKEYTTITTYEHLNLELLK